MTIEAGQSDTPKCPWCGGPVPPGRTFCRLSCRTLWEHREQARLRKLFGERMTLESELPTDADLKPRRRL